MIHQRTKNLPSVFLVTQNNGLRLEASSGRSLSLVDETRQTIVRTPQRHQELDETPCDVLIIKMIHCELEGLPRELLKNVS
jgi:hypothetical protein